jgi:hypothetical protein
MHLLLILFAVIASVFAYLIWKACTNRGITVEVDEHIRFISVNFGDGGHPIRYRKTVDGEWVEDNTDTDADTGDIK